VISRNHGAQNATFNPYIQICLPYVSRDKCKRLWYFSSMTAYTSWLLRFQNQSFMIIEMSHENLSAYQQAKSNLIPLNDLRKNRSRRSALYQNMMRMTKKLLSIHLTFWSSNSGNVKWILTIIRHNSKRDEKLSMAHTTRPGKLAISDFNTLQMWFTLSISQRFSKLIAIMPD